MPESPAATLRRAAEKMRVLANDALRDVCENYYWGLLGGRWENPDAAYGPGVREGLGGAAGRLSGAFTPGVALLIADQWETFAEMMDSYDEVNLSEDPGDDYALVMYDGREYRHDWTAVLTIARAFLGEVADA